MTYRDHFSTGSAGYARYRPHYPDTLYRWLLEQAPGNRHAVDVATGTGQAATGLARHFRRVSAFDLSPSQVRLAEPAAGVSYAAAPAERLPVLDADADLVTVAQALHWLDLDAFYAEVRRVLVPGGVLAAWTYDRLQVDPGVDAVIEYFYMQVVRADWPPERHHVETGYRELPFPFARLQAPSFAMRADWTVDDLLGYLGTWSATRRCHERTGNDPISEIADDLRRAFGPVRRQVSWPLTVLAGRHGAGV